MLFLYAVNRFCQFLHAPRNSHMTDVKCILCYFRHTTTFGLRLWPDPSTILAAFSDVDWAGSLDDRRSQGGHVVLFGPNLIAWSARKQATVSHSSTEAETRRLLMLLLKLYWRSLCLEIWRSLRISRQSFGVIILVLRICLQIQSFMLAPNTLKLTFTL
jgi:hypothetical protein